MTDHQRIILWATLVFIGLCLFGNEAFRSLVVQYQDKRHVENNLSVLRTDHERLNRELTLIQKDPSYTEYLIRKNLGYVKKGEIEYQFLKPDQKHTSQ